MGMEGEREREREKEEEKKEEKREEEDGRGVEGEGAESAGHGGTREFAEYLAVEWVSSYFSSSFPGASVVVSCTRLLLTICYTTLLLTDPLVITASIQLSLAAEPVDRFRSHRPSSNKESPPRY